MIEHDGQQRLWEKIKIRVISFRLNQIFRWFQCLTPCTSYLFSNFHRIVSFSSDASLIWRLNWRFSRQVIPGWEKAPHRKQVDLSQVWLKKKRTGRKWNSPVCHIQVHFAFLPCNVREICNVCKLQTLPVIGDDFHRHKQKRNFLSELSGSYFIKIGAHWARMLVTRVDASQQCCGDIVVHVSYATISIRMTTFPISLKPWQHRNSRSCGWQAWRSAHINRMIN